MPQSKLFTMTKRAFILFITLALIFMSAGLFAQIGPPPPPASAPVDGGAIVFLAASAVYGYKKIRERNRQQ
jgi:hypothetical protein